MRSFVNLCERSSGARREEVSMGATALKTEHAGAFNAILTPRLHVWLGRVSFS